MKTYIILLIMLLGLIGIFVGEHYVVTDFCSEFETKAQSIKENIKKDENPEKNSKELVAAWNRGKSIVYVFVNHNSFTTLEEIVYDVKYSVKEKKYDDALYLLDNALRVSDDLRKDFQINTANIF